VRWGLTFNEERDASGFSVSFLFGENPSPFLPSKIVSVNRKRVMKPNKGQFVKLLVGAFAVVCCLVFVGCEGAYDVPITSTPTRRVDGRLIGDWKEKDGSDLLKVRRYDDSVYIVSLNGDLYRAFHSDAAGLRLITAQEIDSPGRKYTYFVYQLSAGGDLLELRPVNEKVIPKTVKSSAALRRLIAQHAHDPNLFDEKGQFVRQK
jgi:hypothetical protein